MIKKYMDSVTDIDIDNIVFDNFNGTASTTCNNHIKPITQAMINEAIRAMKKDMSAQKVKFYSRGLGVGEMIGFNSTTFSAISIGT